MSIRSDYNPEQEHINKIYASIEQKLGPIWWFADNENALIRKLDLAMLTDEEKCYALDRYRRIKSGDTTQDPKPQYPTWVIVGCVTLAIILFVWGFCRG